MAKRLSIKQKKEILKFFLHGKTLGELSQEFNCTKLTISRNLKKELGEEKYKAFTNSRKLTNSNDSNISQRISIQDKKVGDVEMPVENFDEQFPNTPFIEIAPLNYQIDNTSQKELTSISISEIKLPSIVYMIVAKKIELEIKCLGDYPKWEFLSQDELERKTIEIYDDLRIAKSFCGKEQKVIKVPNVDVFKLVAPILRSRGISRIVSSDQLISL